MSVGTVLATKGSKVITIHPDQTVKDALAMLAKHNIGALVVVDDSELPVGIISERDIVRDAARNDNFMMNAVQDVMTKDVVTGTAQDDLRSVANLMTERRFRHLPIVEDEKLIGIVSIGDIVKAQRDQYQGEVETLQTQIMEGE